MEAGESFMRKYFGFLFVGLHPHPCGSIPLYNAL